MSIRVHRKPLFVVLHALLLAAQLLWTAPAGAVSESPFAGYFHTGWMPSDGAPGDIRGIVQDADGWLWIGGSTGLYRFDGHTFERMEAIDGHKLHKTNILSLAYLDGALWVGYGFGGIERFKNGVATYFGADAGLPGASVHRMVVAADGTVSAATAAGLYEWHGKVWSRAWPAAGLPFAHPGDMVLMPDGDLLIVHDGSILRRKKGEADFKRVPTAIPAIHSLYRGTGDIFYTASKAGFQRYDTAADQIVADPATPNVEGSINLYFETDGTKWLGLANGVQLLTSSGASRVDAPESKLTREGGLSDSNVQVFFQDREGNLWLGTAGGIDRLRRTNVHTIALPANTHNPGIALDDDGVLYFSSRFGPPMRTLDPNGVVTAYPAMPLVESITRGANGAVWVANSDNVARYLHGKETLRALPGPEKTQPQSMSVGADGSLWLSMVHSHAISHLRAGLWETASAWSAYPETVVSLHFDDDHRLWQTFIKNRVAVSDGKRITRYTSAHGLDIGNVLAISTRGGRVWVGGDQNLMYLKDGRFFALLDSDGKAFTGVSGIVETADGDLWLHGTRGITHIGAAAILQVRAGGAARVAADSLNYEDGVIGQAPFVRPLPSLQEGPDGRLWYNTGSSVGWIDPHAIRRNGLAPAVKVRALASGGAVYPPSQGAPWRLPPRSSSLRLDYTALTLTMPDRVRFRYRLQGSDDAWTEAGNRRSAFYTNLGPGAYRFDVQAANEDGAWNTAGAHQDIVIAPTVLQTPWFRFLCGLVMLFMLWLLYRWRLHRLSQRMRTRMDERLDERSRIARELHDTLLQSVQGLVLKVHGASQRLPAQEPVRDLLDAALTQAETTIADGRNRVQDLRTHEDGSHLLPLLKASGNAWAHDNGTEFKIRIDGEQRLLSPGVGSEVLAICREAMRNAFRHAQAGQVDVSVRFGPRALMVTVADDGIGISPDTVQHGRSGHFGLVGMRERAARLGGTLLVAPRPEGGTVCTLTVSAALAYAVRQARWWQ